LFDILSLCALVASAQQDYDLRSAEQIVDPVARPVSDPHFHDTLADASGVPGISLSQRRMRATMRATALASLRRHSQAENSFVWRTSTMVVEM
jgi:hypothetical protein